MFSELVQSFVPGTFPLLCLPPQHSSMIPEILGIACTNLKWNTVHTSTYKVNIHCSFFFNRLQQMLQVWGFVIRIIIAFSWIML